MRPSVLGEGSLGTRARILANCSTFGAVRSLGGTRGVTPVLVRLVLAPLTLLCLGYVAGCGSQSNGVSSKAPGEILDAATSAALHASAVHLRTSSSVGGSTLALNMAYTKDGAQGQISLLGLSFELVRIGDTLYVEGNMVFDKRLGETLGARTGAAVAKLVTTGKPYPILQRRTGRERGQSTFTKWNKPVTLAAPTGALNINQLNAEKRS